MAYIDTSEGAAVLDAAVRFAARAKASLRLLTVVAAEAEVLPLFVGARPGRNIWPGTSHQTEP